MLSWNFDEWVFMQETIDGSVCDGITCRGKKHRFYYVNLVFTRPGGTSDDHVFEGQMPIWFVVFVLALLTVAIMATIVESFI